MSKKAGKGPRIRKGFNAKAYYESPFWDRKKEPVEEKRKIDEDQK